MRAFTRHEGVAAVLRRDHVDTDVIIPLGTLMVVPRAELGRYAFEPLRYAPDGSERPDFVLNRLRDASILVAGRNFGAGSSREGAVQALAGAGIRVVVAESFGDIFAGNCVKNGLLAVALPREPLRALADRADAVQDTARFVVDLERQTLAGPGLDLTFAVEASVRARLLAGRDEITATLELDAEIRRFQDDDRRRRPWVWARAER